MAVELKIDGEWLLPLQSGYSPSFSFAPILTDVQGGFPRIRGVNRNQPIPVSATYRLSKQQYGSFLSWWWTDVQEGAVQFQAYLDIGQGIQEYTVQLTAIPEESWDGDTTVDVSMSVDVWTTLDSVALSTAYAGTYSDGIVHFYIGGGWKIPSVTSYSAGFRQTFASSSEAIWNYIRLDYWNNPAPISIQIELFSAEEIAEFFKFYYGACASGMKRCKMQLDLGLGLGEYVVQFISAPKVNSFTGYYANITINCYAQFTPVTNWSYQLYCEPYYCEDYYTLTERG